MNEEALNLSIRKFLKTVGVSSQREIEHAVAKAIESGSAKGATSFPARMTLEIAGLGVSVTFDGKIDLE
jgi:cation transport ATPase